MFSNYVIDSVYLLMEVLFHCPFTGFHTYHYFIMIATTSQHLVDAVLIVLHSTLYSFPFIDMLMYVHRRIPTVPQFFSNCQQFPDVYDVDSMLLSVNTEMLLDATTAQGILSTVCKQLLEVVACTPP